MVEFPLRACRMIASSRLVGMGRKVRAPQGTVLANGEEVRAKARADGKRHRKEKIPTCRD